MPQGGSLSAYSSTTDANGQAEVRWTLGTSGSNQVAKSSLGASQEACSSSTSVDFQAIMNAPVVTITNATTELVSLNSCDNGGSLFRHTLTYTSNVNLQHYYIDILSESVFSNGDISNLTEQASLVDATQVKSGNCTKFGETSYIDRVFTIQVNAKDANGNKTGPMLAESNKSNKVRNIKPANGARTISQQGAESEQAANSGVH